MACKDIQKKQSKPNPTLSTPQTWPRYALPCRKQPQKGTAECQDCSGWSHTTLWQMPHPPSSTDVTHMRSGLKRWMTAHRARPLFQEVVRSVTFTFRYPSVCFWHHVRSLLGRMSDSAQTGEQIFQSLFACSEGHKC